MIFRSVYLPSSNAGAQKNADRVKPKSIKNKVLSIKYGKRIGLLTVLLLATGYLILNTAPAALAQETQRTYTITPPTITQKLNPGQNAEGVLKVYNNTDQSLTFTTSIKDFIVEDTLGTPQFLPNNTLSNKYSAASWIGVTPSTFTIAPHQRQELNYYIHAPANARPDVKRCAHFVTASGGGRGGIGQRDLLVRLDWFRLEPQARRGTESQWRPGRKAFA